MQLEELSMDHSFVIRHPVSSMTGLRERFPAPDGGAAYVHIDLLEGLFRIGIGF